MLHLLRFLLLRHLLFYFIICRLFLSFTADPNNKSDGCCRLFGRFFTSCLLAHTKTKAAGTLVTNGRRISFAD